MMDKSIILQVHTILCMIIVITQSATVPDNVVWTPPTATLWLGQTNPSLTCEFIGAPYAVYWLKDSETILTWYQGTTSYGQGIDGTLFGITADHHTLLFNDLTESDSGTYTCKVSNYNGFIISNQTEVRVRDPQNIVAYTKPNITTWKGSSEYLPCDFTETASKVLWNKIDNSRQPAVVETVLRYADDTYEVIGSNSRFFWSKNYQLYVRDIEVLDGATYTCIVWKTDGTQLHNSTIMTVNALPEEPYVQITQCDRCMAGQEDQHCAKCTHNVTHDAESFTLDCSVNGAKPKVTDITWTEGAPGRVINNTQVAYTPRADSTFDTRVTMSAKLAAIADGTSFTCTATGTSDNGTWNFYETVSVRVLPPLPPSGLSSGAKAGLCILFLLLLLIICCIVFVYLYRNYNTCLQRLLPTGGFPDLEEKRENIRNYVPGTATNFVFPENKVINIGLFGIMSAGKSAFIKSLHFALKGTFQDNITITTSGEQGGSASMYREAVPLTERVHLVDTRGMKDYDLDNVNDLVEEIRGERGQDTENKTAGGIEIHCPVFVVKSSDVAGLRDGMEFLKTFSDGVHEKFGRHVHVVLTHTDLLENEQKMNTDKQDEVSGKESDETQQPLLPEQNKVNDSSEGNEDNTRGSTESTAANEDTEINAGNEKTNQDKLKKGKDSKANAGFSKQKSDEKGDDNIKEALSKVKKIILDYTNIPKQNVWAFVNYTVESNNEDRERSIEFLNFLSVCLDTAERNAKFLEESNRERNSKL